MKASHLFSVSLSPRGKQRLCVVALFLATAGLAGCENYTAAPVCTDANAVVPAGTTGVYTVSTQDDQFKTTTTTITVTNELGKGQLIRRAAGGDEQDSRVCQVDGQIVEETFNKDVKGYQQMRLYVTGMGLTELPLFYDKAELDQAGIPSQVFELPEQARQLLGPKLTHDVEALATHVLSVFAADKPTGLMVDNASVSPEALMSHAKAGPVGLTLLRR